MSGPIAQAHAEGRSLLNEVESKHLLEAAGIPTSGAALARTADEAARLADELGYLVVLKILSPDLPHKGDVGGVILNLGSADAVRAAYDRMVDGVRAVRPDARID